MDDSSELIEWKKTEKSVLVINYTMTCALSCDFCCYRCSPKRTEKMSVSFASDLIKQASDIKSISSIAFTGGEPLYYLKEIMKVFEQCYNYGFGYTVATACHWANTPIRAFTILEKMKGLGLTRLNISADYYHQKFIPLASVENVIYSANKLGINTYVVGSFLDPNDNMNNYIKNVPKTKYINFISKYVSKVGGAKKWDISQKQYGLNLDIKNFTCYRRIHHDIAVWNDGSVYPCCSTFNRDTPGIKIGNIFEESLSAIYEKLNTSSKYKILKRDGFGKLYEIVKKYDPELHNKLPSTSQCVGPCSLCNSIFSNTNLTKKIETIIKFHEADEIIRILKFVKNTLNIDIPQESFFYTQVK